MIPRRPNNHICALTNPERAGRRRFGDFLAEYSEPLPGHYVDVDSGSEIGRCQNMAAVTYGQRASIGGNPDRLSSPLVLIYGLLQVFMRYSAVHPCTSVVLAVCLLTQHEQPASSWDSSNPALMGFTYASELSLCVCVRGLTACHSAVQCQL